MEKNSLWKKGNQIFRLLEAHDGKLLVIDCMKRTMPKWVTQETFQDFQAISEEELLEVTGMALCGPDLKDTAEKKLMHEHFTMIAGILPFLAAEKERSHMISVMADRYGVSKQTVRGYLCLYLVNQDMSVFAPKPRAVSRELTMDEKNMRWALNKFYYHYISINQKRKGAYEE